MPSLPTKSIEEREHELRERERTHSEREAKLARDIERWRWIEEHRDAVGVVAECDIRWLVGGGRDTAHYTHCDLKAEDGTWIEVKYAAGRITGGTKRTLIWEWDSVLGNSGRRLFHSLLLVGRSDPRYSVAYRDQVWEGKPARYVMFDVPFAEVEPLTTVRKGKGTKRISLTTNPRRGSAANKVMFEKYQITRAELAEKYRRK